MTNQTHPQEVPELVALLEQQHAATGSMLCKRAAETIRALELQSPSPGGEAPAAAMPGVPSREVVARALCAANGDNPDRLMGYSNAGTEYAKQTGPHLWETRLHEAAAILKLSPSHSGETGEVERLREVLEGIRDHARVRIQDGKNMGAAVWRIALEDVDREATAALKTSPDDGGLS